MITHNIKFHKIRKKNLKKNSLNICFLGLSEEFRRDSNTSSNGKRAISVRAIEVRLYHFSSLEEQNRSF